MSAELAIINKAKKQAGHTTVVSEYNYDNTEHIDVSGNTLSGHTENIHDIFNDTSIISTYQFNDDVDDLGDNYDGTPTSITYGTGVFGKSAIFSGSSYIHLPNGMISDTSEFSISFWIKSSDTKAIAIAFINNAGDSTTGTLLFIVNSGNWFVRTRDTSGTNFEVDSGVSTFPTFTHITITLTDTLMKLYIDGTFIDDVITSGTRSSFHDDSNFGGDVSGGWGLSGELDQIRIFDRELTSTEVGNLYNELIVTSEYQDTYDTTKLHDIFDDSSIVATYTMNGNTNDLGGNYDGTPINITYSKGNFYGSRAAVFNGTSIFHLPNGMIDTSIFSVSTWIKSTTTKANAINFMVWAGTNASNSLSLNINGANWYVSTYNTNGDGFIIDTGYSEFNSFTHIFVNLTVNSISLYINSTLVDSITTTGTRPIFHDDSGFGGYVNGGWELNGQLDQTRIFNRDLTESEINILYQEKIVRKTSVSVPDIFGDSSIVAHYKFDGDVTDETGNYNGINNGVDLSGSGIFNKCLTYNGTTIDVNTGYKTNGGDYSISCWVKLNEDTTSKAIYTETDRTDNSYGTWLITNASNYIRFGHFDNGSNPDLIQSDISLDITNWYHVVVTRENGVAHKIYINGILSGSGVCVSNTTNSTYTGKIGSNLDYTGTPFRYFDGKLDQFRIFNKTITHKEVLDLYNEKPEYKVIIQR